MIIKQLKNFLWEFDEESKELTLTFQPDGISEAYIFKMDKVRMLSLTRFIIRVMARLSTPRRIKK